MSRFGAGQFRDAMLKQTVHLTQFAEIRVPGSPIYLNPHEVDFTWNNKVWIGTRGLGAISVVRETPAVIGGIELTLSGVIEANVAEALDPKIRNAEVILYLVALNSEQKIVPNPIVSWIGFVDRPVISIENNSATVTLACEHISLRNKLPRTYRYTHEDQQILFPPDANNAEDRGFEFVTQMVERTVTWPQKAFFEKQARGG
jgi:hypothetical protein